MVTTLSRSKVDLLRQYENHRRIRKVDSQSRSRYLRIVRSFLRYTGGDLSESKLLEFIFNEEYMKEKKGRERKKSSAGYQKWVYQVIKNFYKLVGEEWPLGLPKDDLPSGKDPQRPYLETEEAEQLLELAKSDLMDHAMFRLALVTGIRKREIRDLNLSDYNPPRIKIETRKSGERRIRTLDEETVEVLNNYIAGPRTFWDGKHKGKDVPLFLSPRGERLPDSTLTKRFRNYMKAIGKPKGCGMHSLRRTCVTWEAEGGMDAIRLQDLHGWKSSEMPAIYARLNPVKLEKEAYEANPLIGRKRQ